MATGRKTYNGAIGMAGPKDSPATVKNVLERAEELGKSTGVITSVPLSHATPAGFVAHNRERDNYEEIAQEMISKSAADVIMGCGDPYYDEEGGKRSKPSFRWVGGEDLWKAVVAGTAGGDADGDGKADPWKLVQTREEFKALASGDTPKRVIGVPLNGDTLQEKRAGDANAAPYAVPRSEAVPTLAGMTKAALNVLDNNPKGFFLMVEGGAVDFASHSNRTGRMVEEECDFADAVKAVSDWVDKNSSWSDTLVVVTADHETGYVTGPDSGPGADGKKPVWNAAVGQGEGKLPLMAWHASDHTNNLVPLYAKGDAAKVLDALAVKTDPVRGRYADNTDIAKTVFQVMR